MLFFQLQTQIIDLEVLPSRSLNVKTYKATQNSMTITTIPSSSSLDLSDEKWVGLALVKSTDGGGVWRIFSQNELLQTILDSNNESSNGYYSLLNTLILGDIS